MSVALEEQAYLEGNGYQVWLLLVSRNSVDHLIRVNKARNLSYGLVASGDESKRMMVNLIRSIEAGSDPEVPKMVQEDQPIDPALFRKVALGNFAVEFPESSDSNVVEKDFLKSLTASLDEWVLDGSGNHKSFPAMKHPYWPIFRKMLEKSLTRTVLYRGIYGDNAVDAGDSLRVWKMSSWTTDKKMAKDFAIYGYKGDLVFSAATGIIQKVRRGEPWAVYQIQANVKDILIAPVYVEGFIEPDILIRYLAKQSEYVLWSPSGKVSGKIVARNRSRT